MVECANGCGRKGTIQLLARTADMALLEIDLWYCERCACDLYGLSLTGGD
jgi:hypothetical protein